MLHSTIIAIAKTIQDLSNQFMFFQEDLDMLKKHKSKRVRETKAVNPIYAPIVKTGITTLRVEPNPTGLGAGRD